MTCNLVKALAMLSDPVRCQASTTSMMLPYDRPHLSHLLPTMDPPHVHFTRGSVLSALPFLILYLTKSIDLAGQRREVFTSSTARGQILPPVLPIRLSKAPTPLISNRSREG